MGMENPTPKVYSPKEIEEMEKKRARVDKLRESDSKIEDSVYDLAKVEDKFRNELREGKSEDDLANEISDETLEKIEAQKISREAQEMSREDVLTGLRNRRALEEDVPKIISLEKREKRGCSILLMDLDDFKKVNDTHGHSAGDEALKKLAEIIKNSIRNSDFSYRFGGEEFVVVLPNTGKKEAVQVAEKIREAVEKAVITVVGNDNQSHELRKTISVGCVSMQDITKIKDMDSKEILSELLIMADVSAYESKKRGKNQVTSYSSKKK